MTRIDAGYKALTSLSRTYGQLRLSNANEAETRIKVIDETLISVLGWTKDDISVEERISEDGETQFADYVVRTAATAFLVEAKRAGSAFVLPARKFRLKLGGVLSEGQVGEAIRQARDYCRRKAVPFACVTNGSTWIVFPAVRTDQITFEESEARIFRDLDDIRERFVEFWELLSRERTLDGNLQNEILGRTGRNTVGLTLRDYLPEPGYRLGRNALYAHIEPAVAAALSDEAILDDVAALQACYVKTSERLKYDSRLSMHLRDTMPLLGHKTVRLRARKQASKVDDRVQESQVGSVPRFIVILGPVGAGKTTFLHYTRKVSAASAIDGRVVWLHLDFKKATVADEPRDFLLNELLLIIETEQDFDLGDWERSVSLAYAERIRALRRGPLHLLAKSDPSAFDRLVSEQVLDDRRRVQPYVETILNWATKKWPTFLVIDNVDQIENLDLQERIFGEAQALARRIGCNIIMSLRESTFLRHRDRPSFDAFQFESFYIDPPNVLPVLSHRFSYAKKVLTGREVKLTAERGISVFIPDLGRFFDLVSQSVLDGDTGFMIECLAGGNIRRGLHIVREFLASGHTNADRAIAAYIANGDYSFPRHEIFKGAVLGPFKYYNDTHSLVPNLYDSKIGSAGLQLLRLQIVSFLVRRASEGIADGTHVPELTEALGRLGVTPSDVLSVLGELQRRYMLQTTEAVPITGESWVVPTRLAGYSIKVLCSDFAYCELCCLDSTIYDPDSFEELRDLTEEVESSHDMVERIAARKARVLSFVEYLLRSEAQWIVEARRRELNEAWKQPIVAEFLFPKIKESVATVVRAVERRRAREAGEGQHRPENRSRATSPETCLGEIVTCWPDKEYVFIRDQHGSEWFAHRNDFLTDSHWRSRQKGARCAFLQGEWQGRPRAVSVRIADEH